MLPLHLFESLGASTKGTTNKNNLGAKEGGMNNITLLLTD